MCDKFRFSSTGNSGALVVQACETGETGEKSKVRFIDSTPDDLGSFWALRWNTIDR